LYHVYKPAKISVLKGSTEGFFLPFCFSRFEYVLSVCLLQFVIQD